jgi:hypothetical protein
VNLRIYTNGREDWRDAIRDAIADRCAQLGIPALPLLEHDPATWHPRSLVLYLSDGSQPWTQLDEQELSDHLAAGRSILPVVDTAVGGLDKKLPQVLWPINAFQCSNHKSWVPALVDDILSYLWLNRRTRKIFISYKRTDSAAVAHQLYMRFVELGYQVFLDDCSIDVGADFQREIKWWLNDADAVLVLGTSRLPNSPWVLEEIQFANLAKIELLAVTWPGAAPLPLRVVMEDQRVVLTGTDFEDRTLAEHQQRCHKQAIDKIVHKVQEQRIGLVTRRLRAIVPYVEAAAADAGFEVIRGDCLGDLLLKRRGAKEHYHLRVLPFRPTAEALYALRADAVLHADRPVAACVYPENDVTDARFLAMRWLTEEPRPNETPSRYRLLTVPIDLSVLP